MSKKTLLLIVAASMVVAPYALAAGGKASRAQTSPAVAYVRERGVTDLKQFSKQVRAYTLILGDKRIIVGVDFIRNQSGISQELPSDLSDYVINVIGQLAPQFATYRKYGGISEVPGALLAQPPQPDPGVDFWISGSLQRVSEIAKYESKKGLDGTGGGGHTQWDAHAGRNRSETIKALTVTFTLTGPDKVSIPGASATYRIDVGQKQRERSFSVYVAGSGISLDSTVTITENLDDAIYDATAAAVIHLLGNALMVPYYRCSPVFQADDDLDARVRGSLARLTQANLEHNIKVWAVVAGYPVAANDLQSLTDHDRAVVEVEMLHRKLPFNNDGLVEFAFSLWKDLDYIEGAKRVESDLTEMARIKLEEQARLELAKLEQAKREKAETFRRLVDAPARHNAVEIRKPIAVRKPVSRRRRVKPTG
jgi:hypothetical protein